MYIYLSIWLNSIYLSTCCVVELHETNVAISSAARQAPAPPAPAPAGPPMEPQEAAPELRVSDVFGEISGKKRRKLGKHPGKFRENETNCETCLGTFGEMRQEKKTFFSYVFFVIFNTYRYDVHGMILENQGDPVVVFFRLVRWSSLRRGNITRFFRGKNQR